MVLFFVDDKHSSGPQKAVGHEVAGTEGRAAPAVPADDAARAGREIQDDLIKQRPADQVFRVGGRPGLKTDGGKHIPGGHFAGVVHSGIGQMFRTHIVEAVQHGIDDPLTLFGLADKRIDKGQMMPGLVAVAILPDEAGHIFDLVAPPGFGEKGIQLLFNDRAPAFRLPFHLIKREQALNIVGRIEEQVPGIGFAPHVLEVRIVRVKILQPFSGVVAAAIETGGDIKNIPIILALAHQTRMVRGISDGEGDLGHGIVVVSIFQRFLRAGFVFFPERNADSLIRFPSIPVFPQLLLGQACGDTEAVVQRKEFPFSSSQLSLETGAQNPILTPEDGKAVWLQDLKA